MTESDYLARYTRIESESPWHGASQFALDASSAEAKTVVSSFK